ncbi:MAG: hypothetical protein D6814_17210 [Calditrichaeota bacterium]|nr:MAG: hypothetical protein D6814_17210 [Calditrichota bacterium]
MRKTIVLMGIAFFFNLSVVKNSSGQDPAGFYEEVAGLIYSGFDSKPNPVIRLVELFATSDHYKKMA